MNALLVAPNQEWALDFVSHGVASGRGIRILTVIDGFTRECPAIEVGVSLGSRRVTRVLERVIAELARRRACAAITVPNLPAATFSPGVNSEVSRSSTSNPAVPCKTDTWKASTAAPQPGVSHAERICRSVL